MTGFQKKQVLQLDVHGAAELQGEIAALPNVIQRRLTRRALTVGARFLAAELRAATPVGKTGNLRGSIGYEIVSGFQLFTANIGARKPEGSHAHLVDQGTAQRFHKDGRTTGRNQPQRFFERTLQASGPTAEDMIAAELTTGLEAEGYV